MPLALCSASWQPLSYGSGTQPWHTRMPGCVKAVSLRLCVRRNARSSMDVPWSASCRPKTSFEALHSIFGAQPGMFRQRNGCRSIRKRSCIVCYQGNPGQVAAQLLPVQYKTRQELIVETQAARDADSPVVKMSPKALAAANLHVVPFPAPATLYNLLALAKLSSPCGLQGTWQCVAEASLRLNLGMDPSTTLLPLRILIKIAPDPHFATVYPTSPVWLVLRLLSWSNRLQSPVSDQSRALSNQFPSLCFMDPYTDGICLLICGYPSKRGMSRLKSGRL